MGVKSLAVSVSHTVIAFSLVLGTLAMLGLWPESDDPTIPDSLRVATPGSLQWDPNTLNSATDESLLQSLIPAEEEFEAETILDVAGEYAALDFDMLFNDGPDLEPVVYQPAPLQHALHNELGYAPSGSFDRHSATLGSGFQYGQQSNRRAIPGHPDIGTSSPAGSPAVDRKKAEPLTRHPTAANKGTGPSGGSEPPLPDTSGEYPAPSNLPDGAPLMQRSNPPDTLNNDTSPLHEASPQPALSTAATPPKPGDIQSIPEPRILLLMLSGFLLLGVIRRRSSTA